MKRPTIPLILLILLSTEMLRAGGFSRLPIGARTVSLGGSLVSFADDPNVVFYNPAGIASLSSLSLATSYTQLFPGISDDNLQYFSGSAALHLDFLGNVGVGVKVFTSNLWKENELVGSYAREVADFLSVGGSVKLLYWSVPSPAGRRAVPEPGLSKLVLSFDAGLQSLIRDIVPDNDLRLGLYVGDINRPSIAQNGSDDGKLNFKFAVGATYLSHTYDYAATVQYTVIGAVKRYGVGAEFSALRTSIIEQPVEVLVRLGGGGLVDPGKQGDLNGGFGLRLAGLWFDYAYSHQTELLYVSGTHHLSLRFSF